MPEDDIARYLGNQGTLDSLVEIGLDSEIRSGLGIQPEHARAKTHQRKMRSLMFSYQEQGVLEREVNDEGLAILRQKEDQAKSDDTIKIEEEKQAIQTEMDELQ